MSTDGGSRIETPERLAAALRIAAELEHLLCCEYLFAAFTLRRTLEDFADSPLDEPQKRHVMALTQAWATQVLTIARQEMEHLAIVVNLEGARAAASFRTPELPRPPRDVPAPRPLLPRAVGGRHARAVPVLRAPRLPRDGGRVR